MAASDIEPWSRYLNVPAVLEHTSWNHPTPTELQQYLGNEADRDPAARLRLAIALLETDALVGTIGFHSVSPPNRVAELAYDLDPTLWGRGIASAIAKEVVAWGHSEALLVRIQATVLRSNARSVAVLELLGFEREGLLRSYRLVRGQPGDFYMYAHVGAAEGDV